MSVMTPEGAALVALDALKAAQRDMQWLVDQVLTDAAARALTEGWDQAMAAANRAIAVRDAMAERIALIAPEIEGAAGQAAIETRQAIGATIN
ncbi:MAG: hypothetical protein EG825_13225 [Rhodocyclaceae bacterium]|nr:hypothetical protein [Rhodocyclaceae bacterium]